MKRKLALLIATLAVAFGSVAIVPGVVSEPLGLAPEAAEAHTDSDSYSYCRLIEVSTFGAEQNYVGFFYRTIHFYGFQITDCCFVSSLNPSTRAMARFTIGFGIEWIYDPWC